MRNKLLLLFSVAGLLFSGYLSGVKIFKDTCAFNESCPYFLGYPACYYGFVMFLALSISSLLLYAGGIEEKKALQSIFIISIIGILFAGYFTLNELPKMLMEGWRAYILGLPTCALGLIFYITISLISRFAKSDIRQ